MPKSNARMLGLKSSAQRHRDTTNSHCGINGSAALLIFNNGDLVSETIQPAKTSAEVGEKIKELIRLANEQGYLTYGDINDALPSALVPPEQLDEIHTQLRG